MYFKTKYGYFNEEGDYIITNVLTPAPWVNILTNGRYGAVYSQAGSGYSFYIDASESMLTRWVQDLVKDDYGKYFYIKNKETNEIFSVTYQPMKRDPSYYSVIFSPGRVQYIASFEEFDTNMIVFVPQDLDVEVIRITLKNKTKKPLKLSLFSYFELNMGTVSDVHREFHKLFFETHFSNNFLINRKYMWTAGTRPWNDSYPYILFHGASHKVVSFESDKRKFLGLYGDLKSPQAVLEGTCKNSEGRNIDAINSLHVDIELVDEETIYFFIGVAKSEEDLTRTFELLRDDSFVETSYRNTLNYWKNLLENFKVNVPDKDIEFLLNKWLPYQAIAGRLMALTAYYQIGGAYGFRDQLQDSLAALWLDPSITKRQILFHASHQYKDGKVQHWWTPLSNRVPSERWSDDLLWLPFVVCEYIEHTGDREILKEEVPFLEDEKATLKEHCLRSIESVLSTRSERGIPLILHGDWNDGLNGVGAKGKGESFWLAEFLYFIINRVLDLFELSEEERTWLIKSRDELKKAFNEFAWNGKWFNRATKDDRSVLGGLEDSRIFLNPQNWAVISDISDKEKCERAIENVKEKLITDYGPLLLFPPFLEVDPDIGYITRYAPGTRENGGVYTHAATWTLWTAWKLKDHILAEKVYQTISPVLRSFKDPDVYSAEPYVTPGNSNGPFSKEEGKAGWTWYTGSAAWLYRLLIERYLGIKPTTKGILFSPVSEKRWKEATFKLRVRGGEYEIKIVNPESKPLWNFTKIIFNGQELKDNLIPYLSGTNYVEVIY